MEEYMGKAPVIGESMISEMEGLKGVVTGQREEIEKRDKMIDDTRS